jgi:hypothetical protein
MKQTSNGKTQEKNTNKYDEDGFESSGSSLIVLPKETRDRILLHNSAVRTQTYTTLSLLNYSTEVVCHLSFNCHFILTIILSF